MNEPIYKEMSNEQKLKILIGDYFNTAKGLNESGIMVLCLMAYYMGKAEALEKQNETNQ